MELSKPKISNNNDPTNCPICTNKLELFAQALDIDNPKIGKIYYSFECKACKILFQYPFWYKDQTAEFYPENYYAHSDLALKENQKFQNLPRNLKFLNDWLSKKFILNNVFRLLRSYLYPYFKNIEQSKCVLDIGCGKGLLLDVLKAHHKETYGLEPSAGAKSLAIAKGHKMIDYSNLSLYKDKFDLITMFQSVEHLSVDEVFNKNYFQQINELLIKNGTLIIETPNYDCSLGRKYRENWRNLDLPRHLIIFSPASLSKILVECGFKVKIYTRLTPFDISASIKLKSIQNNKKFFWIYFELFRILINHQKNASLLTVVAVKI